MAQYWLKPFGTTNPRRWINADWIPAERANLDHFEILSGPSARNPPQMGKGDSMIFHAVGHARIFGAAEILDNPTYHLHPFWKDRFPWVYPVRVDVWIPVVTDGPKSSDVAPTRAVNRLRAGGPYALLTIEQYRHLVDELMLVPSVQTCEALGAASKGATEGSEPIA
jgi:hypothetical protein